MKPLKTITILLGISLSLHAAKSQDTDFDIEKARESIATLRAAQPEQPRKVLIFSGVGGFRHNAIEFGKQVLPLLGEMTGAYDAVVSDDPANFEKETLAGFDAVIFNNTSGRAFHGRPWKEVRHLPDEERKPLLEMAKRAEENLIEFINNGGGFVGIHAATDTYTNWNDYVAMIGGKFEGHPWNKRINVVVDIVEPKHPLVTGIFEENSFALQEEIYIMKDVNDEWIGAHDRRMLLKLNIAESQKRPMPDDLPQIVPISWIKEIGQGRLFYTSLGHNVVIFEHPGTLELYLRGIQYACGDIPADASFTEEK